MNQYPLIKFAIFFITGIIIQYFYRIDLTILFISSIVLLIILLLLTFTLKRLITSIPATIIASLLIINIGALILESGDNETLKPYSDIPKIKNVYLSGTIEEIDLMRAYEIRFVVSVDTFIGNKIVSTDKGKLLCRVRDTRKKMEKIYNSILPGNKIVLTGDYIQGRDKRNPGEFDYQHYLLSQGIQGIITSYNSDDLLIVNDENFFYSSLLFNVRKLIDEKLNSLNNEETAGLLRGLLLADRSGISHETKTEFINSGVVHVLAVSGLHVGFIIIFFLVIFGRFNIYIKSTVTAVGLIFFLIITGSPPSVFRASLMALIIITAYITNRSSNVFNSLSIAAIILLLLDPMELFNPGFQLSFSAVIGIASIAPYLQEKIKSMELKNSFLRWLLMFIAVSFAAQVGTLPFTLIYFGKLSLIALLANILVIPLIGMIVGIGIISLFAGIISNSFALYFAVTNDFLVSLLFSITHFTGTFEYSFVAIRYFTLTDSIIFYAFLIFMFFFLKKFKSFIPKLILVVLVSFNIVVYVAIDDKKLLEDNLLNILMIDVGQGDAFLVKFPNGETALIDAGDATFYFDNGERVILPLLDHLGIDKVDYGFISHLHTDHYGGFISLIHHNRISRIIKPAIDSANQRDLKLENYLNEKEIPFSYYKDGIDSIGNVRIYTLSDTRNNFFTRSSTNDKSAVFKIVYGKKSILFTGDAETRAERYLAENFNNFLKTDILKAGHHGSKTSSSERFMDYVNPDLVLISAGVLNKFNHPSKETIEKYDNLNADVLRTDLSGAVLIRSNGDSVYVVDWRIF